MNYPQFIIKDKVKNIEKTLPFSTLFMSTVSGSKVPLHKVFETFSKYTDYGEITKEVNAINYDVEVMGIDINTALERAVERTPSKKFADLLWGILSTNRTGGDLTLYFSEKSKSAMNDYKRSLTKFSNQLTVFVEIYLTAIVLGAIFFTILTSIMAGFAGGMDIVVLQFFTIFIFLPLLSALFIVFLKMMDPGGE